MLSEFLWPGLETQAGTPSGCKFCLGYNKLHEIHKLMGPSPGEFASEDGATGHVWPIKTNLKDIKHESGRSILFVSTIRFIARRLLLRLTD